MDEDEDEFLNIIMDNGSMLTKAGFGEENEVRSVFTTLVKRPKNRSPFLGINSKEAYIGDEVWLRRGTYIEKYPIQNKMITDWDDIEKIWFHTFYNELRIDPEDKTVILSEPSLNRKKIREICFEIMFETFSPQFFWMANSGFLALLFSEKKTGIVIEFGYSQMYIIPIFEGIVLDHAVVKSDFSGNDINDFMTQILNKKNYNMITSFEREIVRDIKEKLCFVSFDYENDKEISEKGGFNKKQYELPDGTDILIDFERFTCPELIFQPNLIGFSQSLSVTGLIEKSISKCDIEIQPILLKNIILSGGSTKFPGFSERLKKEIINSFGKNFEVEITSPSNSTYSVILGGFKLSKMSSFNNIKISNQEFKEFGSSLIYHKIF
ncbi:actin-7-related [Anaeramoeba ignava]|uniref:Actin-7-related n=1 Tax=Anaeramoeba ignava TaxID=1746090 RepID=A0A9Q0LRI4_ANAIG|nr:actin-7-related [Anaeramoeba ignava]